VSAQHDWSDREFTHRPAHGDARAVQWFRPALKTRAFFETYFTLARDGKLDERGMPSLLELSVMIPEFSQEIRPTRPAWAVQRAVATLLAPVTRRRGYRGDYASATRASCCAAADPRWR
jgi:hypothetical protein